MKKLNDILKGIKILKTVRLEDLSVSAIEFDSRKVGKGCLFVAIKGLTVDGHRFIDKAISAGAQCIVVEEMPEKLAEKVCYIKVASSTEALGHLAANFYDNPSKKLKLVGITGTNGKTTSVTLLHRLFLNLGYNVGLLSTIENKIMDEVIPASYTTPDPVELNSLLARMVKEGCEFAFMEVSSHAIAQRRIAGVHFAGGIFSNISLDHLDYHKTFKEYINAKKRFFDDLSADAFALTNPDDRNGKVMVQNTKAKVSTYALRNLADFKVRIIENRFSGLVLNLDGHEFYARLIGKFNAYNLLAVYATAILLGEDAKDVLVALSKIESAEGRFDYIKNQQRNIVGIVDYAHTPDALKNVLETIDAIRKHNEQVLTVVGCGGDRDKTKRPEMAQIACAYSNKVILTSDNPRTEDPNTIIEEMEKGVPAYSTNKVLSITNRRQAIKTAWSLANDGDIILVAGKGHEKYQDINGVKKPFDDKEILAEFLLNDTI